MATIPSGKHAFNRAEGTFTRLAVYLAIEELGKWREKRCYTSGIAIYAADIFRSKLEGPFFLCQPSKPSFNAKGGDK